VCVCVNNQYTKILNVGYNEHRYFGNEVETLYTKEKNHSGEVKPRQFTIQNKKLVYKAIVPLTLTRTYTWTPPNQTSCLNGSSMDSFILYILFKLYFNDWSNHTNTLKVLEHLTISAYIHSLSTLEFNTEFLQITSTKPL